MSRPLLLSPERYLRSGYGIALPDGFSVSTLRTTLARAQNQVNRYLNAPKLPNPYDWRGGTMTNERQQWRVQSPLAYSEGVRRVYVNSGPIKAVTDFHLDLGTTYMITVDPSQLYVNPMEQYIEIVALNPTVVGYYPLAVNLGLYQPIARISYTYGWSFPITGDVLEAESPTVFTAAYGNWDRTVLPVVYFDGVVQISGYSVNYDNGQVTFTVAPSPGVEVSADYTYAVPSELVDAIGITTTNLLAQSRIAQRGMIGLSSIKIAEVSLTQMMPTQMANKNGVSIPQEAADLLTSYSFGSVFR
jgi:hypothetical protein